MAEQPSSKVEKDLLPTANTPGEQDNAAADEPVLAWEGDTFDLPAGAEVGLPGGLPLTEVHHPPAEQGRPEEAPAADSRSSSARRRRVADDYFSDAGARPGSPRSPQQLAAPGGGWHTSS